MASDKLSASSTHSVDVNLNDETAVPSAKQAMDDYYSDMFGGMQQSPLEETAVQEDRASDKSSAALKGSENVEKPVGELPSGQVSVTPKELKGRSESEASDRVAVFVDPATMRSKLEEKRAQQKQKQPSLNPSVDAKISPGVSAFGSSPVDDAAQTLAQPKPQPTRSFSEPDASPEKTVVIPAAFPKLAPPKLAQDLKTQTDVLSKEQVKAEAKSETKAQVKTQVAPKAETKPKTRKLLEAKASPSKQVLQTEAKSASAESVGVVSDKKLEQAEPASPETETTDVTADKPLEWLENGRPPWAQERFECLLFTVAGLKLAVPLVSLGSIHKIEKDFTPLVGRADWFLGLYRAGDRNLQVVDSAKWVMPQLYKESVVDGYQFIIRLGDSNWGIACDSVEQAIQLEPNQVKWRTERTKRAWLSGTVIDHMCALLDADMLNYMLSQDSLQRRIK